MREEVDVAGRDAAGDEARDAVEHASAGFFGVLDTFSTMQFAGFGVEQHQIGVGAADVDAEPVAGASRHFV